MNQTKTTYVLGSSDQEIERLDRQSASIEAATRLLLRAAGIAPGMRVLDLGTGIGHVAMLVADLVGPQGSVVAIDSNARLLEVAASRASDATAIAIRGRRCAELARHGALRRDRRPLDPVPPGRSRQRAASPCRIALDPAGLLLALDFDLGSCRTEPPLPLATDALGWILAAFRSAGANPVIGARLGLLLAAAGVANVQGFGVQGYIAPGDPAAPALLSGVVRTLVPQIVATGLATPEQIGIDTLEARLADAIQASGSVLLPPTLVAAWGRRR